MSSKSKTTQNSTMTYGHVSTPDTPDVIAARNAAQESAKADPTIPFRFARAKQNLDNGLNSKFGADYAPETREAMKYSRGNELDQEHGLALQQDAYRRQQQKFGNLYQMAGLTQPRVVQTGGSSQGTVSQPMWPGLISGGLSAGLGAI